MAQTFHCSIVTPAEKLFEGEVTYVTAPGWDGQFGVLPNRSAMLTELGVGPARIDTAEGTSLYFLVDGGFAQISDDTLYLVTEFATLAASIDAAEAQAELAEANARVTQSAEDQEQVRHDQVRAMVKKSLATKAGTG